MTVAQGALDLSTPNLSHTYNYSVPEQLSDQVALGSTVVVPVKGRKCLGYVVDISDSPPRKDLKNILDTVDLVQMINPSQIELSRWMADYYLCNLTDILKLTLPPGGRPNLLPMIETAAERHDSEPALDWLVAQGGRTTRPKFEKAFGRTVLKRLISRDLVRQRFQLGYPSVKPKLIEFAEARPEKTGIAPRGPKQKAIWADLTRQSPAKTKELLKKHNASRKTLTALAEKGLIKLFERREERVVDTDFSRRIPGRIELNREQKSAVREILASLKEKKYQFFLLEGITGSGKTEVYMRAAEQCLRDGKSAIFLVPEISILPQLAERLSFRFGEQIAVLHSGLKKGERFDAWMAVATGRKKLVVGARSAIFAPAKEVGLIVVDEEHETSYKQNTSPRYDARVVAKRLAELSGSVLVFGSATPSMESRHLAQKSGRRLKLTERVAGFSEPEIKIVDMRAETAAPGSDVLSELLILKLKAALDQNHKAILLLNRRGFANFLLCRQCGTVPNCDNCSVSLTFHKSARLLRCHHCDLTLPAPSTCPNCSSSRWRLGGVGTERVEKELTDIFPDAPIVRMDSDTTASQGAHRKRLLEFYRAKKAVLLGTQMIAKGLDFPEVALVGIVNADTALNLPDFRAGERTAQLLTQVSGRSGRGPIPGEVIIQTFNPENYAVRSAITDYEAFIKMEMRQREALQYPPFTSMINIIISSPKETLAGEIASELKQSISASLGEDAKLLGPAPAPISRIKKHWRWHLTVVTTDPDRIKRLLKDDQCLNRARNRVRIIIDIDPVWLL